MQLLIKLKTIHLHLRFFFKKIAIFLIKHPNEFENYKYLQIQKNNNELLILQTFAAMFAVEI